MSEISNVFTILDGLVDQWCERRALCPLRIILQGYPLPNNLTDGWHMLYEAIRSVRALCREDLTAQEQRQLGEAIVMVQSVLENR
jgi:hypothetical protein